MMYGEPPGAGTLEVTLLGPGYGETVLVHFGSNRWLIVDSCLDLQDARPAAIGYLESLGIEPGAAVDLITASHWHDDHIRGLAEVLERCSRARFACSAALSAQAFVAAVSRFNAQNRLAGGSGVNELYRIYALLPDRGAMLAIADRRLLSIPTGELGHGLPVEVWSLSPADKQVDKFLVEIGAALPKIRETKYRAVPQQANDLSVVLLVSVGDVSVLLGGDLEETTDSRTGWSAIIESPGRPSHPASVFKIPHHGSITGHHDTVWDRMVERDAWAMLTPFTRGRKRLPDTADVARILGRTPNAYSTSVIRGKTGQRRSPAVERTLKEVGVELRPIMPRLGVIRLRRNLAVPDSRWQVELFRDACHLSDL